MSKAMRQMPQRCGRAQRAVKPRVILPAAKPAARRVSTPPTCQRATTAFFSGFNAAASMGSQFRVRPLQPGLAWRACRYSAWRAWSRATSCPAWRCCGLTSPMPLRYSTLYQCTKAAAHWRAPCRSAKPLAGNSGRYLRDGAGQRLDEGIVVADPGRCVGSPLTSASLAGRRTHDEWLGFFGRNAAAQ